MLKLEDLKIGDLLLYNEDKWHYSFLGIYAGVDRLPRDEKMLKVFRLWTNAELGFDITHKGCLFIVESDFKYIKKL